MNYVVKGGDLYLDENGSFVTDRRYAERFASREEAMAVCEFGDRVVRIRRKCATTLRAQVAEFHAMIGEPAPIAPEVPNVDAVRLRMMLVGEEFFETAGEFMPALHAKHQWAAFQGVIDSLMKEAWQNKISLPKLVKELADLAYVVEGSFQRLGIDSGPILAEVHRSNMAKRGAGKDANGKWQKPAWWTPPDIAGELRKQGWKGGL